MNHIPHRTSRTWLETFLRHLPPVRVPVPRPARTLACPQCGSDSVSAHARESATGVRAPDGYRERWTVTMLDCGECGYHGER